MRIALSENSESSDAVDTYGRATIWSSDTAVTVRTMDTDEAATAGTDFTCGGSWGDSDVGPGKSLNGVEKLT